MRAMQRFFEEGDKVKITLRYRGREMAHQEIGTKLLDKVKADVAEFAKVEQDARFEGRQVVMVLAPRYLHRRPRPRGPIQKFKMEASGFRMYPGLLSLTWEGCFSANRGSVRASANDQLQRRSAPSAPRRCGSRSAALPGAGTGSQPPPGAIGALPCG
jgi:hypothetical protein